MKLHFLFDFKEGPWGGGNQFLKALRNYFREKGIYSENAEEAEAILINGHQYGKNNLYFLKLWKLLRSRPDIVVLHRVDGPISIVRGNGSGIDKLIYFVKAMIAHGTIFQSRWSRNQNLLLGMQENKISTIITNAPDPNIFCSKEKQSAGAKTRIISTSWSPNPRKGFNIYKYLDRHLNWDRYEMTFIGNSPGTFSRIKHIPPVKSSELASLLHQHDIFLTASQNDPCSNSLIEALHCGLPSIALNSGGHPEIIKNAGELFEDEKDVLNAIDKVAADIEGYRRKIDPQNIADIGNAYYNFAKEVASVRNNKNRSGQFSLSLLLRLFVNSFVHTHLPG